MQPASIFPGALLLTLGCTCPGIGRSNEYFDQGRYEEAIEGLSKITSSDHCSPLEKGRAHALLGDCNGRLGEHVAALGAYERGRKSVSKGLEEIFVKADEITARIRVLGSSAEVERRLEGIERAADSGSASDLIASLRHVNERSHESWELERDYERLQEQTREYQSVAAELDQKIGLLHLRGL